MQQSTRWCTIAGEVNNVREIAPATWVMHRSPRSVQSDWYELSGTTIYTVNTKYRAVHERKLYGKKSEREGEKERGERGLLGFLSGKRSRARSRGCRMEFTPTNSISVWEKTRSSTRSSMHAPRGSIFRKMQGIVRRRAQHLVATRGRIELHLRTIFPWFGETWDFSNIPISLFLSPSILDDTIVGCPRSVLQYSRQPEGPATMKYKNHSVQPIEFVRHK